MGPALAAIMKVAASVGSPAATLVIPVDPLPTPRPRVGKWGVFYPKNYIKWRDAVRDFMDEGELNIEGPILLVIETVAKQPKKSILTHPKPDVDNYAKAPMDAITRCGGWWGDDQQVVYLLTNKRWTRPGEDAHTRVELYPIEEDTRS